MELLFFMSWIASMVVSGMICENKNRTVWKGVLASFALGWIGTIICACLDRRV